MKAQVLISRVTGKVGISTNPHRRSLHGMLRRTYISSIELGKVSVGIEIANALACAMGMRLSELVRAAE